jgi:hypothetical protein
VFRRAHDALGGQTRAEPIGALGRSKPSRFLIFVDSAHFVDIKANIRLKLHLVRAILHIVEDVFRARLAVYSLWLRATAPGHQIVITAVQPMPLGGMRW